jgi:hypothetical protein
MPSCDASKLIRWIFHDYPADQPLVFLKLPAYHGLLVVMIVCQYDAWFFHSGLLMSEDSIFYMNMLDVFFFALLITAECKCRKGLRLISYQVTRKVKAGC